MKVDEKRHLCIWEAKFCLELNHILYNHGLHLCFWPNEVLNIIHLLIRLLVKAIQYNNSFYNIKSVNSMGCFCYLWAVCFVNSFETEWGFILLLKLSPYSSGLLNCYKFIFDQNEYVVPIWILLLTAPLYNHLWP